MTLSDCDNSEIKNLGYNTMCSLMSGSVQALIDAIGYEEAYKRLEPHIRLNSQFVIARFPPEIGIDMNDNEGVARLILYLISLSSRGEPSYEVGKGSATLYQKKCRNNGQFPHMCEWWCRRDMEGVVRDGCRNKVLKQVESVDRGDECCCWKIEPSHSSNGPDVQLQLPNPEFPMERLDFWARAGPAEYWNNASQVMLELVGEERGRRLLCKYAKIQGEAYGVYCQGSIGKEMGRDLLIRSVDQADAMWDYEGRMVQTDLRSIWKGWSTNVPSTAPPSVLAIRSNPSGKVPFRS